MYRFFLVLVCAAMVLLGCGPALTQHEICMGNADSIERESERIEARRHCGSARETIVGIEYASGVYRSSAPAPTRWICQWAWSFTANGAPEHIRAESSARTREAAVDIVMAEVKGQYDEFKRAHPGVTPVTGPMYIVLCWQSHHTPDPRAEKYPKATWPRPHVPITDAPTGKPMSVPAALAWDPSKVKPSNNTSSGYYCAGVVWGRTLLDGIDMTPIWPRWLRAKNVPGANPTDAHSMARARLLELARQKAIEDRGRLQLAWDASKDIPSSESIACWLHSDKPPSAPMGWPERWRSWSEMITGVSRFADWNDEIPPPTKRH